MTTPTFTDPPPAPLDTDTRAPMVAKALPFLRYFDTLVAELRADITHRLSVLDSVTAAAVAANLNDIDLALMAGRLIGVKFDGTGVEPVQISEDPASDAAIWQALTATTARRLTPAHLGAVIDSRRAEIAAVDLTAAQPITLASALAADATRVTIAMQGGNLGTNTPTLIQLVADGATVDTGYTARAIQGSSGPVTRTDGFPLFEDSGMGAGLQGVWVLDRVGGNVWHLAGHGGGGTGNDMHHATGFVDLGSDPLEGLVFSTVSGAAYTAGTIRLVVER